MLDHPYCERQIARPRVWHPIVVGLWEETVAFYCSSTPTTMRDACDFFYARLPKRTQHLTRLEAEALISPSRPTLTRWLRSAANANRSLHAADGGWRGEVHEDGPQSSRKSASVTFRSPLT